MEQDPRLLDMKSRQQSQIPQLEPYQGGLSIPPEFSGGWGDINNPAQAQAQAPTQIRPMMPARNMNNADQMAMAQQYKQRAGFNPASMNRANMPMQAPDQAQMPPQQPAGTPAQMPMSGQMNRPRMQRPRMGMQRPMQNPNAMPKSVSSF